jgi:hypothetical protein
LECGKALNLAVEYASNGDWVVLDMDIWMYRGKLSNEIISSFLPHYSPKIGHPGEQRCPNDLYCNTTVLMIALCTN